MYNSNFGTSGNDILAGTNRDDNISGQAGNDLLEGKAGNGLLDGGEGNDALLGGGGNDTLRGGAGDDTLDGDGDSKLFGLTSQNTIVAFNPSRLRETQSIAVQGVDGTLVGIDLRSANGLLYGVSSTSKLYTIDITTGNATLVSTLNLPFNAGQQSGVDFNPVVDRLRLVGSNDQNLRVNVDNGVVADNDLITAGTQPDTNLAYASTDVNVGKNPNVTAAAYTNAFLGAAAATRTTQLFGIDSNLDTLVLQNPPNAGTLNTIGSLGADFGSTAGFDVFSPTNGINITYAVSGSTLYSINLSTGAATVLGTVGDGSASFVGLAASVVSVGSGNDTLEGGDGNDTLRGGAGNDTLLGSNGNDSLSGDAGNDLLNGGDGNDTLRGGIGNDSLKGENGTDSLNGGEGNDDLDGGDGNDILLGEAGNDLLKGANGEDQLDGGEGNDDLNGGDGNDLLRSNTGNDTLSGESGSDALLGGEGNDTLRGGAGDDTLDGDGDSKLFGLTSQNTIVAFDPNRPDQATSVSVTGIAGNLLGIDVRSANGLLYGITDTSALYTIDPTSGAATLVSTLNLPFNAGQQSGVDFNPVVDRLRLVGSNDQNLRVNVDNGVVADNDLITAGTQPDTNLAYASTDVNVGKNPNVTAAAYTNAFLGAAAATRTTQLFGIDSNLDTLVLQNPPNAGTLNTIGSLGADFGSTAGFDVFSPTSGINLAYAVSGATLYSINLSTGAATTLGRVGNGSASFVGLAASVVSVGSGNDTLEGGDGNDTLRGGAGNDSLDGGNGSDTLNGQAGNDRLTGGNDNDILIGGAGKDSLTGGGSSDQFTFGSNASFNVADFGVDRIQDFATGVDKIVLDKTSFSALQSTIGNGFSVGTEFAIVSSNQDVAISSASIVYNRNSGNLFYNQNGAAAGFGTGDRFATLAGSSSLTAADFQLVA